MKRKIHVGSHNLGTLNLPKNSQILRTVQKKLAVCEQYLSVLVAPSLDGKIFGSSIRTDTLHINWSTSELNTLVDPTTYLDYTDCWIQVVTAATMAVTSWIQLSTCILNSYYSNWTGEGKAPLCN